MKVRNTDINSHFATVPVVCSYCGKSLGTVEVAVPTILTNHEDIVSHGVCQDCKEKLLKEDK